MPTRAKQASKRSLVIPSGEKNAGMRVGGRDIALTNLEKPFWPDLGITKRDLLQYYADVSAFVLPHIRERAMVMKRYPNGAYGDFFFQKHAPESRPDWIPICSIPHASGNIV